MEGEKRGDDPAISPMGGGGWGASIIGVINWEGSR